MRRRARHVGVVLTTTADLVLGAAFVLLGGTLYAVAHHGRTGQPVTVTYGALAVAGTVAGVAAFALLAAGMAIQAAARNARRRACGKATGAASACPVRRAGWAIAAAGEARQTADLIDLAVEARTATNSAHTTYRTEALLLGRDASNALVALSDAANRLETIAAKLERLAAEDSPST